MRRREWASVAVSWMCGWACGARVRVNSCRASGGGCVPAARIEGILRLNVEREGTPDFIFFSSIMVYIASRFPRAT